MSYLFAAGLAAWAIEHIAYIIQYGSLFDEPRAWVQQRTERSWWWRKVDELIHCQLCTTTQLSFWLWALPELVWGWAPLADLPGWLRLVVVWFSQSAFSLLAYDLARFVGRGTDALIWRARKGVGR